MPAHVRLPEIEVTVIRISTSPTHVVLGIEVHRAVLARHQALIENLLMLAQTTPDPDQEIGGEH